MQQVKGAVLRSRLTFVEDRFGKDALQRVLASLGDEEQKKLRFVLSAVWYPFELGRALDDAIVQVVGNGRREFFEQLGVASAEQNLSTVHKNFLTAGDPHAFLAKADVIYRTYYETGRREYARTGERSGTLTTHDAETFSAPDCLTVVGWYRRALELCGARGVRVVEQDCRARGGAVCRYAVSWDDVVTG